MNINNSAIKKYTYCLDLLKNDNKAQKTIEIKVDGYLNNITNVLSLLDSIIDISSSLNNDKDALLAQIVTIAGLCKQMLPVNEMEYLDKIIEP